MANTRCSWRQTSPHADWTLPTLVRGKLRACNIRRTTYTASGAPAVRRQAATRSPSWSPRIDSTWKRSAFHRQKNQARENGGFRLQVPRFLMMENAVGCHAFVEVPWAGDTRSACPPAARAEAGNADAKANPSACNKPNPPAHACSRLTVRIRCRGGQDKISTKCFPMR